MLARLVYCVLLAGFAVQDTCNCLDVSAKSDFATVENEYELSAELEAFDVTSQKLADFLLPSFHRYWEKGVQVPAEKAPDAPPMSMTDM